MLNQLETVLGGGALRRIGLSVLGLAVVLALVEALLRLAGVGFGLADVLGWLGPAGFAGSLCAAIVGYLVYLNLR